MFVRMICLSVLIFFQSLESVASAGFIIASNSTPELLDFSSAVRSVAFTGAESGFGTGIITDVNISINFAKADGESFDPPFAGGTPFYNEIRFTLTSPSFSVLTLIPANSWNNGTGFFDGTITFDDNASQVVNFGDAPVAGTFKPVAPGLLSIFNDANALGNWDLTITDTTTGDALRFRSFTLEITTADISSVPEPSSIALVGGAVIGLVLTRRRTIRLSQN